MVATTVFLSGVAGSMATGAAGTVFAASSPLSDGSFFDVLKRTYTAQKGFVELEKMIQEQ